MVGMFEDSMDVFDPRRPIRGGVVPVRDDDEEPKEPDEEDRLSREGGMGDAIAGREK